MYMVLANPTHTATQVLNAGSDCDHIHLTKSRTYTHRYAHTCMHKHIPRALLIQRTQRKHTDTHSHTHTYIHTITHIHARKHTHTQTHRHTHIHTLTLHYDRAGQCPLLDAWTAEVSLRALFYLMPLSAAVKRRLQFAMHILPHRFWSYDTGCLK